jgi:hypothetical protein
MWLWPDIMQQQPLIEYETRLKGGFLFGCPTRLDTTSQTHSTCMPMVACMHGSCAGAATCQQVLQQVQRAASAQVSSSMCPRSDHGAAAWGRGRVEAREHVGLQRAPGVFLSHVTLKMWLA